MRLPRQKYVHGLPRGFLGDSMIATLEVHDTWVGTSKQTSQALTVIRVYYTLMHEIYSKKLHSGKYIYICS